MKDPLLQIEGLEIRTDEKILVNKISLHIHRKSITGLVGESGSGKTLTALSILGLLPPGIRSSSGTITLFTKDEKVDLLSIPQGELNMIRGNRISMIFQEPMTSLNPSMRCGKQAMEPLLKQKQLTRSEVKERIIELFREVKLPDPVNIFNAWPHELSGGQRQRVMIAMALSTSPELLIADEPTTALDVTVQKSILELLNELKDKYSLSILFITHDLLVLKQIADNIAVMYNGEIVEQGSLKEVTENPATPYTKGLMACRPGLDKQPGRLPTISDFMNAGEKKSAVAPKTTPLLSESKEIILTVKDLNVNFKSRGRSVQAVHSVTFDVYRGETLGLVGESGCGKTTLGRTILQLVNADSGSILYKSIALNRLKSVALRKIRKNIQIVFQDPYSSLNPRMTVGNIITEPMFVHQLVKGKREAEAKAHKLLEQVGLPSGTFNLYPHQFSGGQRQRIGIARALACQPEFIVLDESVSALDVSIQAQILNLLNDLKDEYNLTYIFISHDLTVVKYMSDRVLVMSEGGIIESGSADQIYKNPSHEYTRQLIRSIPL
jgi:peptide/nickel transport system ATP-binding protein